MAKNITLAVKDSALTAARRYAAENSTTVNALVRTYLERLSAEITPQQSAAIARMRARSDARTSFMTGRTWHREDLYDRRVIEWR